MSKWIVAERRDNKAIIVFNLHSKGVKVSNSFDSMKAADNFIVEHSYNEYFPMLMRDSGISIKTFMAKYPLKQAETTPKKAGIKRTFAVPAMKVKTVNSDDAKQTAKRPAKKVSKHQTSQAAFVASNPAQVSEPKQKYVSKPANRSKAANVPAKLDSFKGLQTIGVTNKGNCFNFVFGNANVLRVELSHSKGVCTIVEIESNESKRFRCSKADFSKASVLARKVAECLGFELGAENLPVTVRKATATTAQAANKPSKVAKPANTPKRTKRTVKHQTSQAAFVASKPAFLPILVNTVATLVKSAANVPAKLSECLPTAKPANVPAKRIVKAANVTANRSNRIIDITPIFESAQIVEDTPKRNVYRSYDYTVKRSVNWAAIGLTVLVCALVCMLFFSGANVPAKPANVVTPAQTVKPANVPAKPAKPSKRSVKPAKPANVPASTANVESASNNADNVSYSTVKQVRKVYKADKKLIKADNKANQASKAAKSNQLRKEFRKQLKAAKKQRKAAKKLSKANR